MRFVDRLRVQWATLTVIVLSVVVHLWELGRRPLAHDEAIDAWFSWQARGTGVIKYDPVYHGPLRFYLEGFVLDHFGITPGWARLVAVLAGIAMTVVIARSKRLLGGFGAPFAALLFTISPTVLTVTRTGREDSLTGLVSLALLLVVAHALIQLRPRHIVGAGALLALSFSLKETTFIFGFAGACFAIGLVSVALLRPGGGARTFLLAVRQVGPLPWMWSTVVFVAIFGLVFTSAFRYLDGFASGLLDGIRYWLGQHDVGRGSQHWYFYGTIYAGYEWLILGVATIGLAVTLRRRSIVGAWFATMAVGQFAVYSWAGEKFAWLALHPLIPAILLAGLGGQAVCDVLGRRALRPDSPRSRWLPMVLVGTTSVLAALTAMAAVRPAITHGADPRELLVTVQTSTRVPELTDQFAAARRDGTLGSILIDERDGGSWPWAWYLHGFADVAYQTIDPAQTLPSGFDAYVVSASTDPPPIPDGYVIERFPLRGWWLPDYDRVTITRAIRWLTTRDTWSPTASSDQYLIVKASAGVEVKAGATG